MQSHVSLLYGASPECQINKKKRCRAPLCLPFYDKKHAILHHALPPLGSACDCGTFWIGASDGKPEPFSVRIPRRPGRCRFTWPPRPVQHHRVTGGDRSPAPRTLAIDQSFCECPSLAPGECATCNDPAKYNTCYACPDDQGSNIHHGLLLLPVVFDILLSVYINCSTSSNKPKPLLS